MRSQALTDYIDVINSEADKRTAQDDPLLAAVENSRTKREESNMSKRDLSPDSLEAQADALLAAADSHGYSG